MNKEDLILYWTQNKLIEDPALIEAFRAIPREKFVLEKMLDFAYEDQPLDIICGQTISQPSTVMTMINHLQLQITDTVLEVGAGSGYCAAIMSKMVSKVYTTEIIPELVEFAKNNLRKIDATNVEVILADGSAGYESQKPYDKIMVTAACPGIPAKLTEQLKENGIIIAPITILQPQYQLMIKGIKTHQGMQLYELGYYRFVPLTGAYGYKE